MDQYPSASLSPGSQRPDGLWFGWDYGHFTDLPEPDRWWKLAGRAWPMTEGHLWTKDEVAAEVESVAMLVATATATILEGAVDEP